MSAPIFTNPHYAWQFDVHDCIASDIVHHHCRNHLARRLRQAFFMEIFYEYNPTCPIIGL